ncbi:L-rhamnose-binding lectin ELEL-1-like [Mya arenaria]|uniref:L-rhamnose-binding lectin ELEL-1-like n=1 Tax=Mya arenaria TaxID=6604 RepID=UPI0022E5BFCC|nr:L-rhamnose-binding lectin ELEL-1-like [Mya arenaria]
MNTVAVFLFAVCAVLAVCSAKRHVFICEGSSGPITCAEGKKMNVLNAYYGRTHGNSICYHSATSNQNCKAYGSEAKIRTSCHNQQSCSLTANNGVFGDPCVGTYKYIEMVFTCVNA